MTLVPLHCTVLASFCALRCTAHVAHASCHPLTPSLPLPPLAGRFLNLEPVMYNTETNQWSAKGSLAQAIKPRLYHSSAILLPSCQVMASGSDVSS